MASSSSPSLPSPSLSSRGRVATARRRRAAAGLGGGGGGGNDAPSSPCPDGTLSVPNESNDSAENFVECVDISLVVNPLSSDSESDLSGEDGDGSSDVGDGFKDGGVSAQNGDATTATTTTFYGGCGEDNAVELDLSTSPNAVKREPDDLDFEYEVRLIPDLDTDGVEAAVRSVEAAMLDQVARDMEFMDCDDDDDDDERARRLVRRGGNPFLGSEERRRTLVRDQGRGESAKNRRRALTKAKELGIAAISSAPEDQIMEDSSCTSSSITGKTSVCVPVRGSMRVYFADDANSDAADEIFQVIEDGADNKSYLTFSVLEVSYIGRRDSGALDGSFDSAEARDVVANGGLSARNISLMAGAASLAVLGFAFFAKSKASRRRRREANILEEAEEDGGGGSLDAFDGGSPAHDNRGAGSLSFLDTEEEVDFSNDDHDDVASPGSMAGTDSLALRCRSSGGTRTALAITTASSLLGVPPSKEKQKQEGDALPDADTETSTPASSFSPTTTATTTGDNAAQSDNQQIENVRFSFEEGSMVPRRALTPREALLLASPASTATSLSMISRPPSDDGTCASEEESCARAPPPPPSSLSVESPPAINGYSENDDRHGGGFRPRGYDRDTTRGALVHWDSVAGAATAINPAAMNSRALTRLASAGGASAFGGAPPHPSVHTRNGAEETSHTSPLPSSRPALVRRGEGGSSSAAAVSTLSLASDGSASEGGALDWAVRTSLETLHRTEEGQGRR